MDIILIRHGQSLANAKKIFGSASVGLSQEGIDQCKKSRQSLERLAGIRTLVSPYKRALETMEHLGLKGELENDLREIELGVLEGSNYGAFQKSHPLEAEKWAQDPFNYGPPGGESLLEFYQRVEGLMDRLIDQGQDLVLICHEGFIKMALCYVLGQPENFFRLKADNVSLSSIRVDDGYKYINYMNRIYY